jgi:HSP20 family protein
MTTPAEQAWEPKVNARRSNADMLIELDVPGVDHSSIDVQVLGRTLTVRGVRSVADANDEDWLISESAYGSFERSVELPVSVDSTDVRAEHRNGVLALTVQHVYGESEPHAAHVHVAADPREHLVRKVVAGDFYACP